MRVVTSSTGVLLVVVWVFMKGTGLTVLEFTQVYKIVVAGSSALMDLRVRDMCSVKAVHDPHRTAGKTNGGEAASIDTVVTF